jgi:hypothetical protein
LTKTLETFRDRYVAALAGHIHSPGEATLRVGYELGREAVSRGLTVLELAVAHHEAMAAALSAFPETEAQSVTEAASNFFVESLSAFEMVQRGFREAHEAALAEQRHAAILRQLSTFLADASLALDAADSVEEMLQLVVEQARELVGAKRSSARVTLVDNELSQTIEASSGAENGTATDDRVAAILVGWNGRKLGSIEACDKTSGKFTAVDAAVLVHLAQMASAAVERAQLHPLTG